MSKIREVLESLDEDNNFTSEEELSDSEKWAKAYEMKLRGKSDSAIARHFGVSSLTIKRWLRNYIEENVAIFEQTPKTNFLVEAILFLTKIEEICLYEADQVDLVDIEVTGNGEVKRKRTKSTNDAKKNFIMCALKAREMKINLMVQTGAIPKEPIELARTLSDLRKDLESSDEAEVSKTREEILEEIIKLVEKGRNI